MGVAPPAAASFTRRTALSRLACGSATMLICTRATVNFVSAGATLAMRRTLQPIHLVRNAAAAWATHSHTRLCRPDTGFLVGAQRQWRGCRCPRRHFPEEQAVVRPMTQHGQGAQTARLLAVAAGQRRQLTPVLPGRRGDLDPPQGTA